MPNGDILEWDKQHGEVERYDKTGKNHKGAYDPNTGKQIKDGDDSRTTAKYSAEPQQQPSTYDGPSYNTYIPPSDASKNAFKVGVGVGVGTVIIGIISEYWWTPLLAL